MLCLASALDVVEPDTYQMTNFRSPVPNTLLGTPGIEVEDAHRLWSQGVVFVDVLPRPVKPAKLPAGTIWKPRKRQSIPGAFWFPNTGFGKLPPDRLAYLADGLAAITQDFKAAPIVVFCLADCWMSWNVARRLILDLGYTNVSWFPGGTDDWEFEDLPVEVIEPYPRYPK